MGAIDGVPLLLRAAEAIARVTDERISEVVKLMDKEDGGQTVLVNSLRVTTVEIEIAAVGIFSLFEARMQDFVAKGPFFRRLCEQLEKKGKTDLAKRVHEYYLAVNVLKHGRGTSYDELCKLTDLPFTVKQPDDKFFDEGDVAEPEGLVDIKADGFFDGLIQTLQETYDFLVAE